MPQQQPSPSDDTSEANQKHSHHVFAEGHGDPRQATRGELFGIADPPSGDLSTGDGVALAREVAARYYADSSPGDIADHLRAAIQSTNAAMLDGEQADSIRGGAGTSLVAAVRTSDRLIVANVGNCRAYVVQGKAIWPVTRDHTWGADAIQGGRLTADQVQFHPERDRVTRALGISADVEVDLYSEPIQPRDTIVLCSAAVTRRLSDEDIRDVVTRVGLDQAVDALIRAARERGATGNLSVVVVGPTPPPASPGRLSNLPRPLFAIAVGLLVALVGGGYATLIRTPPGLPAYPIESNLSNRLPPGIPAPSDSTKTTTRSESPRPPPITASSRPGESASSLNRGASATLRPAPDVRISVPPASLTPLALPSTPTPAPTAPAPGQTAIPETSVTALPTDVDPLLGVGLSLPAVIFPDTPTPTPTTAVDSGLATSFRRAKRPATPTAVRLTIGLNGPIVLPGAILLTWTYRGRLAPDEVFDVRVWQSSQAPNTSIANTTQTSYEIGGSFPSGDYLWTIAIIHATDKSTVAVASQTSQFTWITTGG
jgi:protein phosphatase